MLIPLGDDLEKPDLPFVAIGLIALCVVIHVFAFRLEMEEVHTGEPVAREFVMAWSLIPAELANGDFLKLGTHMFLHGDWFHLIGNMIMLWVFAGSLEHGLGSARFLALYLAAGISGGLLHAFMNAGETIPMLGASGAIFGVIGAYFIAFGAMANIHALLIMGPIRTKITLPAGVYVFFWIILEQMLGLVVEEEVGGTGTAWYAHVGGFAAGAVSMFFLKEFVKSRMVMNREGKLEFVDRPARRKLPGVAAQAAEELEACQPGELPTTCPHCQTPLSDDHKLADELYRCPNSDCKRLVYPRRLASVGR